MYKLVKEFHEAFGHPRPDKPTLITEARLNVRRKWAEEERAEFDEAFKKGDLVGCADALADELYFLLGTCVEMGLDMDRILGAVHESNMAKLQHFRPHIGTCPMATGGTKCSCGKIEYNELGKVQKPEGWEPPEPYIKAILGCS
jgi:predicted HAD superfamily Cof-like phosphohydrolase